MIEDPLVTPREAEKLRRAEVGMRKKAPSAEVIEGRQTNDLITWRCISDV